jgi:uncharacterized protein (TIGR02996 family)
VGEEAAFLNAIRENPADDTARLVYADWLEERNDPRAEYIRLRQQFAQLAARINDLAGQFDPAWLAAVGGPQMKLHEITLRSGRWLLLRELRQWNFYEGLLEGLPTQELNQRLIENIITAEREGRHAEPYLIQPPERLIENYSQSLYRDRRPAGIPGIACVARFTSLQPAKDKNRHASELVVIWFQDDFAFPIDPAVREHIRAIDWEKHAADFDW